MNSSKNFVYIVIVLLIAVLIGFGLWFFTDGFSVVPGPVKEVTVGPKWLNQAQFAGMFSAEEEGIYRKHGLRVNFKEFDFETNQINNLMNRITDFALISAEELLLNLDQGVPVRALAAIYQISPYAIASLESSGILSPADFDKKILGNKGGITEVELSYLMLLDTVGLNSGDVTIKSLGFDKREIDNLTSNDSQTVGIYRTDQLYFFKQEAIDYTIIRPEQFGISIYNDVLIARVDLIESNPDLVRNFVHASIEGWEFALANTEKAIEHTLKYVTNESYKNIDHERFILEESIPLIRPDQGQGIGVMNFFQWNRLYTTMRQRGFITNSLDVNNIFTTEFLP